MPAKKIETGTEVTKKVSQFYSKMDRLTGLIERKEKSPVKFMRFKQGLKVFQKYNLRSLVAEELSADTLLTDLFSLLAQAIKTEESKEYIEKLDIFEDIDLFFDYV